MFECVNAPVTFKVGALTLGTLTAFTADGKVYPQDLLKLARDNYSNSKLKLLTQLFQSLDDDGKIKDKITITKSVRDAISKEQNFKDMSANDVSSLVSGIGKTFVQECGAMKHLGDKSLNCNSDGSYYVDTYVPPVVTALTGTGYYKDAAVSGIDYVCGTQRGKTDKEGKFTFEKAKECKFSLAGILLRTTSSELIDGGTILENNTTVAKLLQSIDADGNLSNGIEIDDKVLDALTDALADIDDDTTILSDDTVLAAVVAEVGSQVEGVSGEVRTDEEVQEHLTQTQTEITKELLAGKTFYMAYKENDGTIIVEKDVINNDATLITWTNIEGNNNHGTAKITKIEGRFAYIESFDGTIAKNELLEITDKYIKFSDNGKIKTSYFSISDAKKALESSDANGENDSTTSSDLEKFIIGKTYHITVEDSYTDENGNVVNNNHVETLTFNADGKTLTDTWVENGETKSASFNYSVQGDTLSINGTNGDGETFNKTLKAPVTETNDYISFFNGGRFYKTYAVAEVALESSDANGGNDSTTSDLNLSNIGSNTNALISPNGGERWEYDTNESVNWNTSEIVGDSVDIYVLNDDPSNLNNYSSSLTTLLNNKNWYKFATSVSNNGSYTLNPRELHSQGDAYVILIVGSESGWDISDGMITLGAFVNQTSVSGLTIRYNGELLHSTSIITKSIEIREDDNGGYAHIPDVRATLENGYEIGFKYCALSTSNQSLCQDDDRNVVFLVDEANTTLYRSGGGFGTSDDPYNGKIKGNVSSTNGESTLDAIFDIDDMMVTIN